MFGLFKKSKRPNIYPYLVPNGYLEHGGALIRTLIPNELHLMLVSDHGGAVLCVNDSELAAWGMDKETALKTAQQNLDLELKSGKIGIAFHQGADNTPFIVFSGHWLAAASLFAPACWIWPKAYSARAAATPACRTAKPCCFFPKYTAKHAPRLNR